MQGFGAFAFGEKKCVPCGADRKIPRRLDGDRFLQQLGNRTRTSKAEQVVNLLQGDPVVVC
jgi:hypothetical protein